MLRRLIPLTLIAALLGTTIPAPALALSTGGEIEISKDTDKDIVASTGIVNDPLLTAWVNQVSSRLWTQVARKDVPYNIKILDVADINAFTTGGGYIYINEGTLDFAQSDDELASVIAHETGHNERRHTVTLPAKAQLINLLFGIASIFSPFIGRFGQILQAGVLAKMTRADELQADRYGLLLMSRAGYDPAAIVTFMQHLNVLHEQHSSFVDRYFQDHPDPPARVSHLLGYPELDPKIRTPQQLLVQALHDQEEARYNIAAMKLNTYLKEVPGDPIALLHLGQTELALGQTSKGEQTLGEAAQRGSAETRNVAMARIAELRQTQRRTFARPNLMPLRAALADAQTQQAAAAGALASRRDSARDQFKAVGAHLENINYEIPNFGALRIRKDSRIEAILRNFEAMGRAVDISMGHSSEVIAGIGSLEKNKEGGQLKENADILKELGAPLDVSPIPNQTLAILPAYPKMLADIAASNGDMVRAIDAARGSLALLDTGFGDLDVFIKQLNRSSMDLNGDISLSDYNALMPFINTALASLGKAAVAGSQASQLYNMARSRQLQTRLTMLGLSESSDRYASFQRALQVRFNTRGIGYTEMLHRGFTPGEVAAATIVAADTNTTTDAILQEASATHRSIVDIANARQMHAEALEIFLGLVYLSYVDDPVKEAHPQG